MKPKFAPGVLVYLKPGAPNPHVRYLEGQIKTLGQRSPESPNGIPHWRFDPPEISPTTGRQIAWGERGMIPINDPDADLSVKTDVKAEA